MKWSWQELRKYQDDPLVVDEILDVKPLLSQRYPDLIDVKPLHLTGIVTVNKEEIIAHLEAKVDLILPSSRSLEPVDYPVQLNIDEVYILNEDQLERFDETETVFLLENETINLDEILTDHILLNIPMQVLTPSEMASDQMPVGKGWKVISEQEFEQQAAEDTKQTIDPRLQALKSLLDDEKRD